MAKRLIQGAANPVWVVDDQGEPIGEANPLHVQIEQVLGEMRDPIQGTASVAGDNIIVAAPGAGLRLVVYGWQLQNESATATTMLLRDGLAPAAARVRCLGQNQGDGDAIILPTDHPWRLSVNSPLVLNLSGANQCGYTIFYWVE